MANKIKYASMTEPALEMFSDWNVASMKLEELRDKFKAATKPLNIAIDDIETGKRILSDSERVAELVRLHDEINALEKAYKDDCKPYKAAVKNAVKSLPPTMYRAYCVAVDQCDVRAIGSVTIRKDTVSTVKSFVDCVRVWLVTLGIEGGSDSKIEDLAQNLVSMIGAKSGKIANNEYIKALNESKFQDMLIRAFLQVGVIHNQAFILHEDGSLTLRIF